MEQSPSQDESLKVQITDLRVELEKAGGKGEIVRLNATQLATRSPFLRGGEAEERGDLEPAAGTARAGRDDSAARDRDLMPARTGKQGDGAGHARNT